MYEYSATLVAHVDGDTIHVRIDLGLDIAVSETIRFYGVNAPEKITSEGKVSALWTKTWFEKNAPDGKFLLQTIKDKREKYGRYLGVIWSLDRQHKLNDEQLTAGMAVPFMVK